jgi:uncharacterized protein with von Willebrand factor type A (vWA) domain
VDYVRGHEIQHIKSTTQKAWQVGLQRGCECIIERICKKEKVLIRFRNSNDYNTALLKLQEKGIYVRMETLQSVVHFLCNSLEDGRIELIRSQENNVFKTQMVHIRLENWMNQGIGEKQYAKVEKMTPLQKLYTVLNQILSLATCQVYQKGFAKYYFGTELQEKVQQCIPLIGKAVTSRRCRDCMAVAVELCELLADDIVEAVKTDGDNEKIINWVRMSIKDIDQFAPQTKEQDEEEGSGSKASPFGQSDLYVILPDDEYDEMMDKMDHGNDSDSDGPKMHIRREHPKEEEKDNKNAEEQPDSTGATQKSSGSSCDEANESQQSTGNSSDVQTHDESSGKGGEQQDQEEKQAQDQQTDAGSNPPECDAKPDTKSAGQGASVEDNPAQDAEEQIRKSMKKAADEALGMADDNAKTADAVMKKQEAGQKMDQDVSEPVKKTDTSAIDAKYTRDYKLLEEGRAYEVDEYMPPELVREVETLAKKLENYMKSKKRRYRKFINSGKLDSSRAAMLAANSIDVFKEEKKSDGVKACAEIIVDNSGSMGYGADSKREYACLALAKIEMVFAKFFPIKIFAFDYSCGCVVHEIIKGWNEHFSRSAAYNFLIKGRFGNGTLDDYSIRVATQDLLTRPEKKKLLVVLSDGQQRDAEVLDAVQEARRKGVTVVGIYFSNNPNDAERDRFKNMYEKDYIVTSPDKIDGELLRIMKKFFVS